MAVENQNALNYSLIAIAVVVGYIMYLFFGYIFEIGSIQAVMYDKLGETGVKILPFVLGLGIAGGGYYQAQKNEAVMKFGSDVIVELKKVVWPTRKEVTGTTTAVLVLTLVVAVVLFIFDKLFGWFISILVS